jgi:ABC-2 type transport system ATP-binding protein
MKQRCALIRALLHDPALLLLDEPSKSLDMAAARQLKELLRDRLVRREGKTVLFTTHRIEETTGFCDSFIILRRGKIGAAGTLEDLRRNIQAPTASLEEIYETLCSPNRSHS